MLLLHGWPGFWYDWRRVVPALSSELDVIAPDFRGFGESDKPDLVPADCYTPLALAGDMMALLDALRVGRIVVAGTDIGATVAQAMARTDPERVAGLALFNPPYPGIGPRRGDPAVQPELWYQHFQALPWSDALVARDRETVRLYFAHFYEEWIGRHEAMVPEELDEILRAFEQPGAVRSSFAYYRGRGQSRAVEASYEPDQLRLEQPTSVLWGEADPTLPAAWADRLGEYFADLRLHLLPGIGHFVPIEAPGKVAGAIRSVVHRARSSLEEQAAPQLER